MDSKSFVNELAASNEKLLAEIGGAKAMSPVPGEKSAGESGPKEGITKLLRIALANEISVADLASMWMGTVEDWEFKIALAAQAGDEARHFRLVERRLGELGVSLADFAAPPLNPLFEFLRGLQTPVEKIAAGQFALESVAYKVNENFLRHCERLGDTQTADIYRKYIQPDELHHHEMGRALLEKHARTETDQRLARAASIRTLEIARDLRAAAEKKIGTNCFPGC